MGLKYLLLLRFGLVNLVAFALLGAAWAQGLVAKVINADVTNMVVLICVVFITGLILAGYRLWKVSQQLNAAYNFNPKEKSRAADFLREGIRSFANFPLIGAQANLEAAKNIADLTALNMGAMAAQNRVLEANPLKQKIAGRYFR